MPSQPHKATCSLGLLAHVDASGESRGKYPLNMPKTAPEALRCGMFFTLQARLDLLRCNEVHGPASSGIPPGLY